MQEKIMDLLAKETGGKNYSAHKYGLDHAERPYIDYGEDGIVWKRRGETDHHTTYVPLFKKSKEIARQGGQLLSFFLDGSRRAFKVDDIAYPRSANRSIIYPIIAGQIGVGCTRRENRRLYQERFTPEFVISVPDVADADGKPGFFQAIALKLNNCVPVKNAHIHFSSIIPYRTAADTDKKFEDRGTACIQDQMIKREKEMVADLAREGKLNQDNYLIKDGSLEYRPTKEDRQDSRRYMQFRQNYNWVLGVSKNFNPEVCKDINGNSNPGFIADLPLYHRTPVACFENPDLFGDVQFAVWYIRIRDRAHTRTPFDGILKIEKMLVTHDEIEYGMDSELVDLLSAHIINERTPVCYGSDLRWANHLYPIYLTESFVKSKYLSTESFLHLF